MAYSNRYSENPWNKNKHKETPQEYAERKQREAEERKERMRERKEIKRKQQEERINQQANKLGINQYLSSQDKKAAVDKHYDKQRERSHAEFLERRSHWSFGTSDTRGGYRIGSSSDPVAAASILRSVEDRVKAGQRVTYKENLEARHAYNTLNPRQYTQDDFD